MIFLSPANEATTSCIQCRAMRQSPLRGHAWSAKLAPAASGTEVRPNVGSGRPGSMIARVRLGGQGKVRQMSAIVQVFGRRQSRGSRQAQRTDVQKAPRHEVAGNWAPAGQRALWGFEVSADLDGGCNTARRGSGCVDRRGGEPAMDTSASGRSASAGARRIDRRDRVRSLSA